MPSGPNWTPAPITNLKKLKKILSKHVKIRIYKTIIFLVVLYGCENFSLTTREENRLRVLENRVLRRIFGPKRDEVIGGCRNCVMRSFITCTFCEV
jgi:hypothetical protein